MHERLGLVLEGHFGNRARDKGARESRDEGISSLVERVGLDRLGDDAAREALFQVEHDDLLGAGDLAALDRLLQVVLLADVGHHSHDVIEAVVLFQPADRAGGVQATRITKYRGLTHLDSSSLVVLDV